jgi:uncharacterized protein (DUF302 family)
MEIVKYLVTLFFLVFALEANDIIVKESHCSVDETVQNIKTILKKKGLGIFGVINHQGNAKMVDMKLNASKMIIFGKAELGTALMQQDMTVGLDLPLRILVYRDTDNKVKMAYRDGSWLAKHHILNAEQKVQKVNNVLDKITTKAGLCKKD